MRIRSIKNSVLRAVSLVLILASPSVASSPQRALPNPILLFMEAEYLVKDGKNFTRYRFDVFNKDAFPAELFAAAPSLPPCGTNTSASRTWVELYDQSGRRLNGFCALKNAQGLNGIWFALESDVIPPSWIYIEINDRQTGTKYKSNLAETTM